MKYEKKDSEYIIRVCGGNLMDITRDFNNVLINLGIDSEDIEKNMIYIRDFVLYKIPSDSIPENRLRDIIGNLNTKYVVDSVLRKR